MQAGGGLVEYVERAPGVALRQLQRQLDALRLAARERGGGLPQRDVAKTHVQQRVQLARDRRHRLEERVRLLHRHRQHFVDVPFLVAHLERFAIVALAVTHVAGHVHIRQEMHLHLDETVALARLAAPALHVEGETPGTVAALARLLHLREQLADRRKEARVGGRIGARCTADGALVDADHLVEVIEAIDVAVRGRFLRAVVQVPRHRVIERVVDQRGFTRARYTGDADEEPNRQVERHALQVVARRVGDAQHLRRIGAMPPRRDRDGPVPREILAGQRVRRMPHLLRRALRHHLPAVLAGARAHVDHVVGGVDRVLVMFDHDDAVAEVAQVLQRGQQPFVVALMEADGRLVQHIHHAGETRTDL